MTQTLNTVTEVQEYLDLVEHIFKYSIKITEVTNTGFKLQTDYDFSSEEIALPTTAETIAAAVEELENRAYTFEWMDSFEY